MATSLMEKYAKRLTVSESVFSKAHEGAKMDSNRKLVVATCLNNVSKFLGEAFDSSTATQRSDMGAFRKFCLNLTTVAVPNLIANEIVMVSPMTSLSGYVTYIEYTAGTTKGATTQGDLFNSPFKLGDVDANYTGATVVETVAEDGKVKWGAAGTIGAFGKLTASATEVEAFHEGYVVKAGEATLVALEDVEEGDEVSYIYNNIVVPQANIPTLKAEMKSIALVAHARRIAVYYSQIAAFQAKTDYGFDLGDQLAEKAVGQLNYEIDTEVTNLLIENAKADAELTWSKTLPVGVSKTEHYEGFSEIVEIGKQKIYDATKRFAPNYMLIASNILPVLTFIKGFSAAPASQINGPYFAGTLNGIKVFVTPNIEAGTFVLGVNGDDMMSSAAVYAPYMPVVPTQLLQFADGGTTQGFSTLYDLKILNKDLLVKGTITA